MSGCPNFNHRRSNAPVRGCPMCGEVVNAGMRAKACNETEHTNQRKNGDLFCVGCGKQLRVH